MHEVVMNRSPLFEEMKSFLFERHGVCYYDHNSPEKSPILGFETSNEKWTYISGVYFVRFLFKSEIDAIEFKLRFG